ncbi:Ramp1 [Phodopus roborovskii]|uniref:Receptor activity-modifying protein 1 n=1 Tax=Phodopus roborovskii TaxID=109678 RepID=A0AAU9ZKY4_PHORO|nr:Ramp1 [Phodopus roborovskii]
MTLIPASGLLLHAQSHPSLTLPKELCLPLPSYGKLTYCTKHLANKIGCFWPNPEVDKFFIAVHHHYFSKCPVSGRALRDPPNSVLCPFIMLPITVTLLMTALVVWRSKRTEGIV